KLFERRVPKERKNHQSNHQNLKCDGFAQEEIRIRHHPLSGISFDFGGSFWSNEHNALGIFERVRSKPRLVVSLVAHGLPARDSLEVSARRLFEFARNGWQ